MLKITSSGIYIALTTGSKKYVCPISVDPKNLCDRYYFCMFHFTNEVTKAEKGSMTCSRSCC